MKDWPGKLLIETNHNLLIYIDMSTSTLGRGLGSLIPSKRTKQSLNSKDITGPKELVHEVEINKIQPNPLQPRQNFDRNLLEDLMNSIKVHGIIQPLVVFEDGGGYQLITGERRLRAAKVLGLEKVPVVVRNASEQEKLELALVENVQRQNLNPIERAYGYQRLIDEFNLTQEEVAKKVGQSRVAVTNTIRLLALPAEMQKALQEEKITEGHAKALLGIVTSDERRRLFKEILKNKLSVRLTESQVRKAAVKKHTRQKTIDPNLQDKVDVLQQSLGTKVEIKKQGGQGTIGIHFYSAEELHEIINKIIK